MTYCIPEKYESPWRSTGRTGRNLLRAIILASSGKNILVSGFSRDYSNDLQKQTTSIIQSTFGHELMEITEDCIRLKNAGEIRFCDHHSAVSLRGCSNITYLPDHYEGNK